jgi:hypothetical protein
MLRREVLKLGILQVAGRNPLLRKFATNLQSSAGNDLALEQLAMLEVRRYAYLRTGHLLSESGLSQEPNMQIIVGRKDRAAVRSTAKSLGIADAVSQLGPEEHLVTCIHSGDGSATVLIAAGSAIGVLYGAYQFAEQLGMRFYLHGDVCPDSKAIWPPAPFHIVRKPLFAIRGILPFHDFPEGPDWWTQDDYLAISVQLPKLYMNFIGFHCYPAGDHGPEPAVWIGEPSAIAKEQEVRSSYPAFWANTGFDSKWGYAPMRTSDFKAGAAMLFDSDAFGPSVMEGLMPEPSSPAECNLLFQRTGTLFERSFSFARSLGVQSCLGTETPLTFPPALLKALAPNDGGRSRTALVESTYEGIFRRISQACPVDYYWLWTPEDWTWNGNTPAELQATLADVHAAQVGIARSGSSIRFATCGWVLGPEGQRSALDKVLAKSVPMSCINRNTGHSAIDPAFSAIEGRPKWAIPWLENDPTLTAPQPWVGRMRYDAADALNRGCTGLIGIHWRTQEIAPNVAALAAAAWEQPWKACLQDLPPDSPDGKVHDIARARTAPVEDFYLDHSNAHFGPEVAKEAASILSQLDGVYMPQPTKWKSGPGNIIINPTAWEEIAPQYAFVDKFARLQPLVRGLGNQARFERQLNVFRYVRCIAQLGCLRGKLDLMVLQFQAKPSPDLLKEMLEARIGLTQIWEEMLTFLTETVQTSGCLGTVANLEQHTRTHDKFLTAHDEALVTALGHPLPADAALASTYRGKPRLILLTRRTLLDRGEPLRIVVILLRSKTDDPSHARLYYRAVGSGPFESLPLMHRSRGVYEVTLPSDNIKFSMLEYYIRAKGEGFDLVCPPTAPQRNHTVVIRPTPACA